MRFSKVLPLLIILWTNYGSNAQANFEIQLAQAAESLTDRTVQYDPSYVRMNFPNGDVPADRGVCTDVVIRAYRKVGVDLQKEVNKDISEHFNLYPKNWGMSRPDKNIDHRRVPNLMTFFKRNGHVKIISLEASDYQPGDIVCWNLGRGVTHIGIAVTGKSEDGKRPLIIHNIGYGQVLEDCLFEFEIIGHYTYKK